MELHELASEAYAWFETRTREDGETFDTLKDGAPEWLRDLVYDAHGDFLPEDWRYTCIRAAVEWIADENDPDESGEFVDSQVDVYTGARFAWLASNLTRQGYVDDAADEFGPDTVYADGVSGAIGWGQYMEAQEVYSSVVSALEAELEAREEGNGDD